MESFEVAAALIEHAGRLSCGQCGRPHVTRSEDAIGSCNCCPECRRLLSKWYAGTLGEMAPDLLAQARRDLQGKPVITKEILSEAIRRMEADTNRMKAEIASGKIVRRIGIPDD